MRCKVGGSWGLAYPPAASDLRRRRLPAGDGSRIEFFFVPPCPAVERLLADARAADVDRSGQVPTSLGERSRTIVAGRPGPPSLHAAAGDAPHAGANEMAVVAIHPKDMVLPAEVVQRVLAGSVPAPQQQQQPQQPQQQPQRQAVPASADPRRVPQSAPVPPMRPGALPPTSSDPRLPPQQHHHQPPALISPAAAAPGADLDIATALDILLGGPVAPAAAGQQAPFFQPVYQQQQQQQPPPPQYPGPSGYQQQQQQQPQQQQPQQQLPHAQQAVYTGFQQQAQPPPPGVRPAPWDMGPAAPSPVPAPGVAASAAAALDTDVLNSLVDIFGIPKTEPPVASVPPPAAYAPPQEQFFQPPPPR